MRYCFETVTDNITHFPGKVSISFPHKRTGRHPGDLPVTVVKINLSLRYTGVCIHIYNKNVRYVLTVSYLNAVIMAHTLCNSVYIKV